MINLREENGQLRFRVERLKGIIMQLRLMMRLQQMNLNAGNVETGNVLITKCKRAVLMNP